MNIPFKHEFQNGRIECAWLLWNGDLHREDGPAIISSNGDMMWYQNGKYHRYNGPAVIYSNGEECWYKNGEPHRTDGPAVIRPVENNTSEIIIYWYQNNKLHRTDGPAVTYPDGTTEYWLNGIEYDIITFLMKSYECTN